MKFLDTRDGETRQARALTRARPPAVALAYNGSPALPRAIPIARVERAGRLLAQVGCS